MRRLKAQLNFAADHMLSEETKIELFGHSGSAALNKVN